MIKNRNIRNRTVCSLMITLCYILGRKITLPGMTISNIENQPVDSISALITNFTAGNSQQFSLFTIGLSSWMMTMILWRILFIGHESQMRRMSPVRSYRLKVYLSLILSLVQALSLLMGQALSVQFFLIDCFLLVTGGMILMWLSEMNTRYGLGGVTLLILIGILLNNIGPTIIFFQDLVTQNINPPYYVYWILIAECLLLFPLMIVLERVEYRLKVEHIMINTQLNQQAYIPIKLNSSNSMSIMYALSVVALPHYLLLLLRLVLPNYSWLNWLNINLTLKYPLGVIFYLAVVFILTILFSFINVAPDELAKQLQKRGDYISGVLPGKETEQYIAKYVLHLSFVQATIFSLFLGFPFVLNYLTQDTLEQLATAPSMLLIFIGMMVTLVEQFSMLKINKQYTRLFE